MSYIYIEFYSLESVFTYRIFPSLLDDLLACNYLTLKKKTFDLPTKYPSHHHPIPLLLFVAKLLRSTVCPCCPPSLLRLLFPLWRSMIVVTVVLIKTLIFNWYIGLQVHSLGSQWAEWWDDPKKKINRKEKTILNLFKNHLHRRELRAVSLNCWSQDKACELHGQATLILHVFRHRDPGQHSSQSYTPSTPSVYV